jgi:hypothetical protein
MNQLENIAEACVAAGIDICLLKGTALLVSGVYDVGERDMEDIDILIRKKDLSQFESLMLNMGYKRVCSGEHGFYKDGENAQIDVHTDILYMDEDQLEHVWNNMKLSGVAKIMDDEEHFIYIMHHGVIQHANSMDGWIDDLKRLVLNGLNTDSLAEKINEYNLSEIFVIANKYLNIPDLGLKSNKLKTFYLNYIIDLPDFDDKGHFLRPVSVSGRRGFVYFIYKFLFPDLNFLSRRYAFRPSEVMLYVRPFLLLLKMLQSALYFNPLKRVFEA